MKYIRIILVFLFTSLNIWCQNKGIAYYGHIESPGMKSPSGPDLNAYLIFDKIHCSYISAKDSLETTDVNSKTEYAGSNQQKVIYLGNKTFRYGKQVYYNRIKDSMWWNLPFSGGIYVAEKKPEINWELHNETKKIGNFMTHKATTKFRGRNYTAWYALEIPLPYGPWKLQGLPGLILEAYDTDKEMYLYFKNIEYPTTNSTKINQIKRVNGDENKSWISIKDYELLLRASLEKSYNGMVLRAEKNSYDKPKKKKFSEIYIESFD